MPEGETGSGGGDDLFRKWREMSGGLPGGGEAPDALRAQCEAMFAAWGRFANAWTSAAGTSNAGKGGPFDPSTWMDAGGAGGWGDLWRWFGAPEGAEFWQAETDALKASVEWAAYVKALERYNRVMGSAWMKAFARFSGEMADKLKDAEEGSPDWAAMQARWQAAADAELAAAQASDDFLTAQAELIRTRLACAALLRKRVEGLAQLLGMPTREELDSLHETVHRLGREVRMLRAQARKDRDGE